MKRSRFTAIRVQRWHRFEPVCAVIDTKSASGLGSGEGMRALNESRPQLTRDLGSIVNRTLRERTRERERSGGSRGTIAHARSMRAHSRQKRGSRSFSVAASEMSFLFRATAVRMNGSHDSDYRGERRREIGVQKRVPKRVPRGRAQR